MRKEFKGKASLVFASLTVFGFVILQSSLGVNGAPADASKLITITREKKECPSTNYCQGTHFPKRVPVAGLAINCDLVPPTKTRCCLPQQPHLVCYNIMVEGQFLTMSNDNAYGSTDFNALCQKMVAASNKEFGSYTAATHVDGEGQKVFRYGVWEDITGNQIIQDLACGIRDSN